MPKHPWFLKNYRPTAEDVVDKKASTFYWSCFSAAGALLGWHGYWLNYNRIGPRSDPALAIPVFIMFFAMILLLGGMFCETLPRRGKYIMGSCVLLVILLATNPLRMLTY